MNKEEFAAKLNNSEYPFGLSQELLKVAKENGLVVVYGASDDLMEFEGAINDEVGVCNGGDAIVSVSGILKEWDSLMEDSPTKEEVLQYLDNEKNSAVIEAIWCGDGEPYSFIYKTAIPHACFDVIEGDDKYCRGIVFSISDIANTEKQAA